MLNSVAIVAMSDSEISAIMVDMYGKRKPIIERMDALVAEYNAVIMREGRTSLHYWHDGFRECEELARKIARLDSAQVAYARAAEAYEDVLLVRNGWSASYKEFCYEMYVKYPEFARYLDI